MIYGSMPRKLVTQDTERKPRATRWSDAEWDLVKQAGQIDGGQEPGTFIRRATIREAKRVIASAATCKPR